MDGCVYNNARTDPVRKAKCLLVSGEIDLMARLELNFVILQRITKMDYNISNGGEWSDVVIRAMQGVNKDEEKNQRKIKQS